MRRLLNIPSKRQRELASHFGWLRAVHENSDAKAQILSVSIFDRWLSREEANALLESVSPHEQQRRDSLHAAFCARIVEETEVLSFTFRRMKQDRLVFRRFTSSSALSGYLTPNGGATLGHRQFHVVLPELRCAYYESWDDTNHLYFAEGTDMSLITQWATACGLHVLQSN